MKDTNNIAKLDQQPWDDNVKAVAKFPDVDRQLDADLDWTVELGQAFLDQPKELMDTIQGLRAKAQKAGTLQTTSQQVVVVTNVVVEKTIDSRRWSSQTRWCRFSPPTRRWCMYPRIQPRSTIRLRATSMIRGRRWSPSAPGWRSGHHCQQLRLARRRYLCRRRRHGGLGRWRLPRRCGHRHRQ